MTEGCDLYGTDEAKAEVYGWTRMNGTQETCQTTGGRYAGPCFGLEYNHNGWRWIIDKTGVTTLYSFGAHFYGVSQAYDSNYGLRQFNNSTGLLMGRVKVNTSQQIEIYDADGTLQDTSTEIVTPNVYFGVQIKLVAHATTGSIEVWVDGVQYAIATSIDTMPSSGNQYVTQVIWGVVKNGDSTQRIDDLALWDDAGSNWNTWTTGKDLAIETRRCDAVGNLSQWTKSAGSNNFENVDETPDHDADGTYNYDSVPGNADRINIEALSLTPDAIYNVRTRAVVRKTDAGPALAKIGVYSSTTEDVSAPQGLSTDYTFLHHDNEINPADAAAWEKADIDALQVQYEVA